MATTTTQVGGVDFDAVFDPSQTTIDFRPFKPGTTVLGDDGAEYVYATASAAIAAGATVILTRPAMTVATGAGGFTAPNVAVPSGASAWVRRAVDA